MKTLVQPIIGKRKGGPSLASKATAQWLNSLGDDASTQPGSRARVTVGDIRRRHVEKGLVEWAELPASHPAEAACA